MRARCKPFVVVLLFALSVLNAPAQLTPPVQEPIAGARVGFRGRERKSTQTIADGSFVLRSDHSWGPAVIIPFEFTPGGGMFFVEASGYATFERDIGPRMYQPFVFTEPIALPRRTSQ